MRPDKRLLQLTGNLRAYLLTTSGLGLLGGIMSIAQALCISQVVNAVFLNHSQSPIAVWVWVLLAVIVTRALLLLVGDVVAGSAAGQAKLHLRGPFFNKLLALGPAYTRTERSGELVSVATDGVEALDAYFSQYLPQLFNTMLVPLLVALVVASSDLLSGVVLLVTAPVLPIFMILVGKMANAQSRKQWRTLSMMSAHFLDVLSGLTTLKLFGRSLVQKERIARISEQHRDVTMSVLRVAFLSALVLELAATISPAVIAVEIGLRLLYGGIPFAQAFFVLLLAPEFYMPFRALGTRFHAAMSGGEAAGRMLQIMSLEPGKAASHAEIPNPALPMLDLGGRAIRFEHVSYSYEPGQEGDKQASPQQVDLPAPILALKDISFSIEPHENSVAIVGPSGGGKSTIASLLMRFAEPSDGQIYVDNTPLTDYPADAWRQQVAYVPQNPYLFHTTVLENIRMGKIGANKQEIEQAAKAALAHDFILSLPQGYNTIIGERGARLSGGQAQRLGIARALLKDAPLLILDEATSHLDPETEQLVMQSIEARMSGRTTLIIAHRLDTVRNASRVLVLENGSVHEAGTHAALMQHNSVYKRLVDAGTAVGVAS